MTAAEGKFRQRTEKLAKELKARKSFPDDDCCGANMVRIENDIGKDLERILRETAA